MLIEGISYLEIGAIKGTFGVDDDYANSPFEKTTALSKLAQSVSMSIHINIKQCLPGY